MNKETQPNYKRGPGSIEFALIHPAQQPHHTTSVSPPDDTHSRIPNLATLLGQAEPLTMPEIELDTSGYPIDRDR